MRKLPNKYENPIDNIIYKFVKPHSNQLDNFTPNFITTISVIFGILALYNYHQESYILSAIFYFLSYFYDCVDGFHARRKNMETIFEYYYDHISDLIINGIISYYLIKKYKNTPYLNYIIFILCILLFGMYFHTSCQEEYHNKTQDTNIFLNYFKLCKNKHNKFLIYSRFIGCGTFNISICILILLSKYIKL